MVHKYGKIKFKTSVVGFLNLLHSTITAHTKLRCPSIL